MQSKVFINGQYFDEQDARISVFDHGLLYGNGVFEGIRCYRGEPFRLAEHIDRLFDSAHSIHLAIRLTKDELAAAVAETVKLNELQNAYVRLVVTRGTGPAPGFDPAWACEPSIIIIAAPISLYPPAAYEQGMKLVTASTIRNPDASVSPRVKSLNYLNNILAKLEGMNAGCAEAIMLNQHGDVAECTADNIFVVKTGELRTPAIDAGILVGITRGIVIDLATRENIPVAETCVTRYDLYTADECFITGSAAEIVPIIAIDDRTIGLGKPGPITRRMISAFQELIGGPIANDAIK